MNRLTIALLLLLSNTSCVSIHGQTQETVRLNELVSKNLESFAFITATFANPHATSGMGQVNGCGFVLDSHPDLLLTCNHVLNGAVKVEVEVDKGGGKRESCTAKLYAQKKEHDLVALKLSKRIVSPLRAAKPEQIKESVAVFIRGDTSGTLSRTYSEGVIHAIGDSRKYAFRDPGITEQTNVIVTDMKADDGESGAAIVSRAGVVGMLNSLYIDESRMVGLHATDITEFLKNIHLYLVPENYGKEVKTFIRGSNDKVKLKSRYSVTLEGKPQPANETSQVDLHFLKPDLIPIAPTDASLFLKHYLPQYLLNFNQLGNTELTYCRQANLRHAFLLPSNSQMDTDVAIEKSADGGYLTVTRKIHVAGSDRPVLVRSYLFNYGQDFLSRFKETLAFDPLVNTKLPPISYSEIFSKHMRPLLRQKGLNLDRGSILTQAFANDAFVRAKRNLVLSDKVSQMTNFLTRDSRECLIVAENFQAPLVTARWAQTEQLEMFKNAGIPKSPSAAAHIYNLISRGSYTTVEISESSELISRVVNSQSTPEEKSVLMSKLLIAASLDQWR